MSIARRAVAWIERRRAGRAGVAVGLAACVVSLAAVTGLIYAFEPHVPVLGLAVLYLLAIVPVAALFGRWYAVSLAVACVATFNLLFLPPLHSFTLADSANWFALAAYLVVAIVVSELAARVRARATEAEQRGQEEAFLAEAATRLLRGVPVDTALSEMAPRLASTLKVSEVSVVLGQLGAPPPGLSPHPLEVGGEQVGILLIREGSEPNLAIRRRFLPSLASLLAVAAERDRLASEAIEAARLRESDAVKTAILRAVSHDLRSPLTAIRVAADSLASGTLELSAQDRSGLLETIQVEAKRLERVVGDLLDLSRLEAGAAVPDRELWAVDELVAQAIAQLGGRAADRVRVHGLGDEVPLVDVDAAHIERVLVNLLENAIAFSPDDADVVVRVTSTRQEVVIRVVDRGPGIPIQDLDRIFEPFYQAPVERPRRGSGLGLAIARGFAEANGGRIWAESHPGQGSAVALALPLAPVPVGASRT